MNRVTRKVPPRTPSGLPSTSPTTTPITIGSVSSDAPPESETPAETSAKKGTATVAEIGARVCSMASAGEWSSPGSRRTRVNRPSSTPSMVACTPLSCMNHQPATAITR